MPHGIFAFIFAVATSTAAMASIAAPTVTPLSTDVLHAPERAAALVSNRQQSAYNEVLSAYRDALRANPGDAALAVAECRYIQGFAWSEDLSWADAAAKDLDDCKALLAKHFAADPDAALLQLEQRYGKAAIEYGEPLLARSANWTPAQRAQLHTLLSRAYAMQHDEHRAGEQALLAVQLDPASVQLVAAIRYLAKDGRAPEAVKLLTAAPLPKFQWQESGRIIVAVDVLPAPAARDELRRAQRAGLKIDGYTAARALRQAGDLAAAQAALAADPPPAANETPQKRQFRLDLAFEARNTTAAAQVLSDWVKQSSSATPLAYGYARLLALDPARAIAAPGLALLAGMLGVYLLTFALSPGLLLFPVHYRGTVRARLGKPFTPLFERIGLRHAWYAFAVFIVALFMVPAFRSGSMGELLSTGSQSSLDWQREVAISEFWMIAIATLCLGWLARRLSWREWLGSRNWKAGWLLLPFCCLGYVWFEYVKHRHGLPDAHATALAPWLAALIAGARSMGGLPLVLLLLAGLVPVLEEFVFRGCLLGGLSRHLSFGWANVLQAVVFSGMHRDPPRMVFYFLLALVAGWMAKKTRGLAMPILLHAMNNALFVLLVAG
ncbi:CPBP family intramembrane metalloprotease [Paraburkholderia megapolitana]|uniref:CAAX prenyl protease 2/Lysostaphin resistance protein A-like domain-containing protein n=2 Tax=Paraburkholderia megapolitana TaxID=420953 RepID=A0A1I3DQJ5_9BURK|nr:CPBP family intramembrane metalloprotease [Paraburkholderia megapolitana]SFH89014.1 hypothetical protein SAMN05192543_101467 [Paraburkholderia megapolitana]